MRQYPDPAGTELDGLTQFLDSQRQTLLLKANGLDAEQLAQTHPPSRLSLGGLLNHLALVEDDWLQEGFLGLPAQQPWASVDWDATPDWDFDTAADTDPDPDHLRDRYRQACQRSREVVNAADGLDQLGIRPLRGGQRFTLRWVLFHLIEETARHAGHADLLREAIDGSTGD